MRKREPATPRAFAKQGEDAAASGHPLISRSRDTGSQTGKRHGYATIGCRTSVTRTP